MSALDTEGTGRQLDFPVISGVNETEAAIFGVLFGGGMYYDCILQRHHVIVARQIVGTLVPALD